MGLRSDHVQQIVREKRLDFNAGFSSDQAANNFFNLIPHCIAIGEAAGTAAALSLDQGGDVRSVDFAALRKRLLTQNVPPSPSPALPTGYCAWELLALITGPGVASLTGNARTATSR